MTTADLVLTFHDAIRCPAANIPEGVPMSREVRDRVRDTLAAVLAITRGYGVAGELCPNRGQAMQERARADCRLLVDIMAYHLRREGWRLRAAYVGVAGAQGGQPIPGQGPESGRAGKGNCERLSGIVEAYEPEA